MFETMWAIFVFLIASFTLYVGGVGIEKGRYGLGIFNIGMSTINFILVFQMIGG